MKKNKIIILTLIFMALGLQAENQSVCEYYRKRLPELEQQLKNKDAAVQDYRNTYQDLVHNIQEELITLQSIAASDQKTIEWYKSQLNESDNKITDVSAKLNSSRVSVDAHKKINELIDQDKQAIAFCQSLINQSDEKIYAIQQKTISHDIDGMKAFLKNCKD